MFSSFYILSDPCHIIFAQLIPLSVCPFVSTNYKVREYLVCIFLCFVTWVRDDSSSIWPASQSHSPYTKMSFCVSWLPLLSSIFSLPFQKTSETFTFRLISVSRDLSFGSRPPEMYFSTSSSSNLPAWYYLKGPRFGGESPLPFCQFSPPVRQNQHFTKLKLKPRKNYRCKFKMPQLLLPIKKGWF